MPRLKELDLILFSGLASLYVAAGEGDTCTSRSLVALFQNMLTSVPVVSFLVWNTAMNSLSCGSSPAAQITFLHLKKKED